MYVCICVCGMCVCVWCTYVCVITFVLPDLKAAKGRS